MLFSSIDFISIFSDSRYDMNLPRDTLCVDIAWVKTFFPISSQGLSLLILKSTNWNLMEQAKNNDLYQTKIYLTKYALWKLITPSARHRTYTERPNDSHMASRFSFRCLSYVQFRSYVHWLIVDIPCNHK